MPIETAVLDSSTEYIELVQITFNSGTLRLLKGSGIVSLTQTETVVATIVNRAAQTVLTRSGLSVVSRPFDIVVSQNWPSLDTTWGQIMALSGTGESGGEIANRDVTLSMTSSLRSEVWYGALVGAPVSIWEANRNSSSGVVDLTTTPWLGEVDNVQAIDGINGALTLTLVGRGVVLRIPNASALTSTTSQNKYVIGDTVFDYISGPVREPFSLSGFDPGGGYTSGINFDGGFNFENGFDMVSR
jgi:hypothetical protein